MNTLIAKPLTAEAFAPFGDVIESSTSDSAAMNAARFERFDDLCAIDIANNERAAVSIARCLIATSLPVDVEIIERHPLGSQAFIPLGDAKMLVVVAQCGDSVEVDKLQAFVSNGRQGFNYHRGVWHMPLVSFSAGQEYLIIDRAEQQQNCDVVSLPEHLRIDVDGLL